MRWNAPLSEEHAALLLERLGLASAREILDLGCGWGELLLRAVEAGGDATTGIGVDSDLAVLERGRATAARRGLTKRVTFCRREAEGWTERAERVLCVGASHALGGTEHALAALAHVVAPGGRLLYGDGCWEGTPTPAAAALFAEVLPIEAIVESAGSAGWRILHLSTADQREWDDFEGTWRVAREEWLLANPAHERATDLRIELDELLRRYVTEYRGILGFAYLVLAR
jgi:SAM-dependent methyltransferase